MSTVYMFDVDGTLSEPHQPMSRDFAEFFLKFCEDHVVYLVTGSYKSKVDEQVPVAVQAGMPQQLNAPHIMLGIRTIVRGCSLSGNLSGNSQITERRLVGKQASTSLRIMCQRHLR